jgi:xanthosine utilization system XapX-like protein
MDRTRKTSYQFMIAGATIIVMGIIYSVITTPTTQTEIIIGVGCLGIFIGLIKRFESNK